MAFFLVVPHTGESDLDQGRSWASDLRRGLRRSYAISATATKSPHQDDRKLGEQSMLGHRASSLAACPRVANCEDESGDSPWGRAESGGVLCIEKQQQP